jgi:carbamoylphosphate synthase small subunit
MPAGLVIRDLPLMTSNWRIEPVAGRVPARGASSRLPASTPASLTRVLREKGVQSGCIMTGENIDANAAVHAARRFPGLAGMDLAKVVTTRAALPVERRQHLAHRQPARRCDRSSACTSWPTISASSATSCGCWRTRAAA